MDKSFYVIPTGKDTAAAHVCYCGRCGKRQLLDHYNVQKHEESCNLKPPGYRPLPDDVVIVEEKNYWGYRLEAAEPDCGAGGVLTLSICIPILIKIPGFKDRFSGMEWVPVFVAEFPAGSKNPRVLRNETGFTMEVLLAMIRAGRISSISLECDRDVIRRVFPGVIDVYSLEMFAYIYRNKGYATDVRITATRVMQRTSA